MTTTAAPQHAADLRSRLKQARDQKVRLQLEVPDAEKALHRAIQESDTTALQRAQSKVSALSAGVASVEKVEEAIAKELAAAEADEQQEAGRVRMVALAKKSVATFAAFEKRRAKLATILSTALPELGQLLGEVYACRNGILQESRAVGADLACFDRDVEDETKELVMDLEARGADLSVVRGAGGFPHSRLDVGSLPFEPVEWAWLIQEGIDGYYRGQARQAELARRAPEQAPRDSSTSPEVA